MNACLSPPLSHLVMEPFRGAVSHVVGFLTASKLAAMAPQGNGVPTIVIPGLGTTGLSTSTLRKFLKRSGYAVYDWGLGRNIGPRGGIEMWLSRLELRLRAVSKKHRGARVNLVGWSLGGIYARELAKRCPELVRQVVTLGSPLSGEPDATNGKFLYRCLAGGSADQDETLLKRVRVQPQVHCTSLYSKCDGVVSWESSASGERAYEVEGVSHLGLVSDPKALTAIAHVLARKVPFDI